MTPEEQSKNRIRKIAKVALIVIVAFIVGAAVFFFFKTRVEAKAALRDAKNVRMALSSADIEMYGAGKSVYNTDKKNNIEDGVKEKVNTIYEPPGVYRIDSYSYKRHEITALTYREGNYIVTFEKKGDAVVWDVDLNLDIYHFDETDTD